MKNLKYILISSFFLHIFGATAQNASDEIVFKALNDEMARSLSSLKLDKYNPPFLIASSLCDGQYYSARASMGALIRSKEVPLRNESFRLMVGSYEINDENFSGGSASYRSGGASLSLPKENDYLAIRRVFWSILDKSYKSSIDNYTQKLTALKQQNKDESEKIDDYTRIQPTTFIMPTSTLKYDKSAWEKNVKEISAIFKNYPKIQTSSTDVFFINSNIYLTNSEGTKIKYNTVIACFLVNASTQAEDGEILKDQVLYYTPLIEQLPSIETIKKDVKQMAEALVDHCSAPIIEEAYQGPVVFEGEALATLVENKLFDYSGLFSSREPVYAVGSSRGSTNKIENKIGKRLCSQNISITSEPKTRMFGTTPLVGSFEIDAEGVTPENGLVLVDKGILKTLLSDRIPTPKVKSSNGHNRFTVDGGSEKSPGVINTSYLNGQTYTDFIKTVTEETAKNGLEYFYLIRKFETDNLGQQSRSGNSGLPKPVNIYRVSVKTGEQKLIRSAVISDFPMLSFKYTIAGTSEQIAYNDFRGQSVPVSYIVPKAIAFNDISIEKDNAPKSKLPVVESPLTLK
jgi:PmbA/TldA metallopeptidase C-terminal domain